MIKIQYIITPNNKYTNIAKLFLENLVIIYGTKIYISFYFFEIFTAANVTILPSKLICIFYQS